MLWSGFRSIDRRRLITGALLVWALLLVGVGKWQLNRAFLEWKQYERLALLEHGRRSLEKKNEIEGKFYDLALSTEPPTRQRVAEVMGAPIQDVSLRSIGMNIIRTCRCEPFPGLVYTLDFQGPVLYGRLAIATAPRIPPPWWWTPAEGARHFGVFFVLVAWIICFVGILWEPSLRRRLGFWSVYLALLLAMLWMGQPPQSIQVYTFAVPGGFWIGLGLAAICLYTATRRPRRRCELLCPHCQYNLTGNESGICPECGHITPAEQRRRHQADVASIASALNEPGSGAARE